VTVFQNAPSNNNQQTSKERKSLDEVVAAEPKADYDAKSGGFVINDSSLTSLVYAGV